VSTGLDGGLPTDTEGMPKLAAALLIAVLSLVAASPAAALSVGDPVLDAEEKAFCTHINKYRDQNGLAPLRLSVSLAKASKWMSNDMASMNYFGHTDSLARAFSTRLGAFGYTFSTAKAENIAAGNTTAARTFDQWRSSPSHNATMLNPGYSVLGIGRAYNANATYRWYWTADFGGYTDRTIAC